MKITPALANVVTGGVNIFLKYYDIQRQNALIDKQIAIQEQTAEFLKQQNEIAMKPVSLDPNLTYGGSVSEEFDQAVHPNPQYGYELIPSRFEEFNNQQWQKIESEVKDPVLLGELKKWYNQYSQGVKSQIEQTVLKFDAQRTAIELDQTLTKIMSAQYMSKDQKKQMINGTIDRYAETGLIGDFAQVEKLKQTYNYTVEVADLRQKTDLFLNTVEDKMNDPINLLNRDEILDKAQNELLKTVEASGLSDKDKTKFVTSIKQHIKDLKALADDRANNKNWQLIKGYETQIFNRKILTHEALDRAINQNQWSPLISKADRKALHAYLNSVLSGEGEIKTPPDVLKQLDDLVYQTILPEKKKEILNKLFESGQVSPSDYVKYSGWILTKQNYIPDMHNKLKMALTAAKDQLQKLYPKNSSKVQDELKNMERVLYIYATKKTKVNPDGSYSIDITPEEINAFINDYTKSVLTKDLKITNDRLQESSPFIGSTVGYEDIFNTDSDYLQSAIPLTSNKNAFKEQLLDIIAQRTFNTESFDALSDAEKSAAEDKLAYIEFIRKFNHEYAAAFPKHTNATVYVDTKITIGQPVIITERDNKYEFYKIGKGGNWYHGYRPIKNNGQLGNIVWKDTGKKASKDFLGIFHEVNLPDFNPSPPQPTPKPSPPPDNENEKKPTTKRVIRTPNPLDYLNINTQEILEKAKENQ